MKKLTCLIITMLIAPLGTPFAAAGSDAAKIHKKVQQALNWQLPDNKCVQPKAPGKRKAINDDQGGARTEWDVDTYTIERYERKAKRWEKCVNKYKAGLRKDFETLRNSAQYGLTETQAETILSKMKLIQDVLMSTDGVATAAVTTR